ncbi:recombinase family protein [Candidatus Nomurabacteria bacterium]|nr:recombinase family protein [Candidatus Nomurabacteria bacterium]
MQNQEKYIIYVRKSTDVEDKQVLSVEAQIVELRKYAADNNLYIVDTVIEKSPPKCQSAKSSTTRSSVLRLARRTACYRGTPTD